MQGQPEEASETPRLRTPWIPVLLGGAILLAIAWRLDFLCDDAYISFRYARNLAEGHGLRFNPGDAPVEGFTNLLWVLYLAPFEALGMPVGIVSRATSVPCALALLWALGRELARPAPGNGLGVTTGILIAACCPTLGAWSTGGLSTLPFVLAVFGMFRALAAGSDRLQPIGTSAYPWIAAVVLLRADGFLWVLLACLARAWAVASGRGARGGDPWNEAKRIGAALLVLGGGLLAYRWWTFGDWIPNTARAKGHLSQEGFVRGSKYVASFFLEYPLLGVFAVLGTIRALGRGCDVSTRSALVMFLGTLGYVALVGGDYMAWFRFLAPAVPFIALLGAAWVRGLGLGETAPIAGVPGSPGRPRRIGVLATAVLIAPVLSLASVVFEKPVVHASVREALHFRWNRPEAPHSEFAKWRLQKERAASNAMLGKALAHFTEPGESMVRQGIGAVGYFAGLRIFDPHGLTDRGALEQGVRRSHKNAGHEVLAPARYFDERKPTYFGADIVSLTELGEEPERWKRGAGRRARFEVEIHPLDPALGFPVDCALRLVRYRSWP